MAVLPKMIFCLSKIIYYEVISTVTTAVESAAFMLTIPPGVFSRNHGSLLKLHLEDRFPECPLVFPDR
jgi:hypothetical protein